MKSKLLSLKKIKNEYSSLVLMAPYTFLFILFIIIPVGAAIILSFTSFNAIGAPSFTGLSNYVNLLTNDSVFMQKVLPNTLIYAIFVGLGGYALSFFLAWSLSQIPKIPRTIMTVILYSPSVTGGVLLATIWSSMGIGFLSMLSGILNTDKEMYEAARIDGVKNRFQEIIYITIPAIKPQMMFGAVMAIVNIFKDGGSGVTLSGANPTPDYAGQLIANHIDDYGFIRYEMGYAAAVSTVLLLMIFILSRVVSRVFSSDGE